MNKISVVYISFALLEFLDVGSPFFLAEFFCLLGFLTVFYLVDFEVFRKRAGLPQGIWKLDQWLCCMWDLYLFKKKVLEAFEKEGSWEKK